jgi:hypothetical protein
MNIPIVLFREGFIASFIDARDIFPLLKRSSRMLALNMLLEFSLARAFPVAKRAIGVFFLDMVLEFGIGHEAKVDGTSVWMDTGQCAIRAEELRKAMYSIFMFAKGNCTIESGIAMFGGDRIDICAWKGRKF